jgi:hypothetical protein
LAVNIDSVRHYEFLFVKRKEAYDESLGLAKLADCDRAAASFWR